MKPVYLNIKKCPCCESAAVDHAVLEKRFYVATFQAEINHKFAVCRTCGFYYVENPLDEKTMEYHYQHSLCLRRSETDPVEDQVLADQWNFAREGLTLRGNVAEVGPDGGQFLNYIAKSSQLKTYYVEQSIEACNVIDAAGKHRRYQGEKLSFDVVVMRHVFEHIPEPFGYLCYWNERMPRDGTMFIEVPDWTFLDTSTDGLIFEHVNHFPLGALTTLLQRAGFVVDKVQYAITEGYHTSTNRVLRVRAIKKFDSKSLDRTKNVVDCCNYAMGTYYDEVRKLTNRAGKTVAFYTASSMSSDLLLNGKIDRRKVVCVFDQDKRKQKLDFHGVRVADPSEILSVKPDCIVINSSYDTEIEKYLIGLGYRGEIIKAFDLIQGKTEKAHAA